MRLPDRLSFLIYPIALGATAATFCGIFSNSGPGAYTYKSIRGEEVLIYGKGLYRHMSAEVAPQGIAQDYVTLLIGVPLLLIAFQLYRNKKTGAPLLLAGVLGYFMVTYVFYLVMGMYNALFLLYVFLAGASFFAFYTVLSQPEVKKIPTFFGNSAPVKFGGTFLMVNAALIALLWLSIVVPPLLNGTIIPKEVAHYTTLIVQGLDLAILLPAALVVGWKLRRREPQGLIWGPVYFVFLSLLMTALCAKILAMGMLGYNIVPAVFIIPPIDLLAIFCAVKLFQSLKGERQPVSTTVA